MKADKKQKIMGVFNQEECEKLNCYIAKALWNVVHWLAWLIGDWILKPFLTFIVLLSQVCMHFFLNLILAISPWEIVFQALHDDVEYWGKTLTKSNPKACCNEGDQSKGSRIVISSPLLGDSLQNSE